MKNEAFFLLYSLWKSSQFHFIIWNIHVSYWFVYDKTGVKITKLCGREKLESIQYSTSQGKSEKVLSALFVYIGVMPNNGLAKNLGVDTDSQGYVLVNSKQSTNVEGVYAAGDITGGLKHVIVACGEGAQASYSINSYLAEWMHFCE